MAPNNDDEWNDDPAPSIPQQQSFRPSYNQNRDQNSDSNRPSLGLVRRPRDPLKLILKKLPPNLEEEGVYSLLSNNCCPVPSGVWFKRKEPNPLHPAAVGFAFVEFATSKEADTCYRKLREAKLDIWVGYGSIADNPERKIKIVEESFAQFLEHKRAAQEIDLSFLENCEEDKQSVAEPEPPLNRSETIDTSGVIVSNMKLESGTIVLNDGDVQEKLVKFLNSKSADCDLCSSGAVIPHHHYLKAEGLLVDASIAPPPIEEVICGNCGKNSGLKKCTACSGIFYCSTKCQVKDWPLHMRSCLSNGSCSSPPPAASFPNSPAINVTPKISGDQLNNSGTIKSMNGQLEPIRKAAINRSAANTPNSVVADDEEKLRAERIRKTQQEMKDQAERAAAERQQVEEERRKLAEMAALKRKKEEEEAHKKKTLEAEVLRQKLGAVSLESMKPETVDLTKLRRDLNMGRESTGIVAWNDSKDPSIFYLTADEDTLFNVIGSQFTNARKFEDVKPCVGLVCVAKSVDDGEWYRAVVTKADPTSCEVYFLDFGNYNTLSSNGLKKIPNGLNVEDMPAQAVPVKSQDDDVSAKLEQLLNTQEPACVIPIDLEAVTGIYTVKI